MLFAIALALVVQETPVITLPGSEPVEPQSREYLNLDERLDERLAALAAAENEAIADTIAGEVRSLWRQSAGPTADLLLQRATQAREARDTATADRAYAHLRILEPEFAEGWMASAELAIAEGDWTFALEALDTVVTLDNRRFDAWTLLGAALERAGANEAALDAYQEALALHPHLASALSGQARLERELAGRAL